MSDTSEAYCDHLHEKWLEDNMTTHDAATVAGPSDDAMRVAYDALSRVYTHILDSQHYAGAARVIDAHTADLRERLGKAEAALRDLVEQIEQQDNHNVEFGDSRCQWDWKLDKAREVLATRDGAGQAGMGGAVKEK